MDKKEYLKISNAKDIKNKKERLSYRFFEMIPGALSLGTLVGVFIFSWIIPSWVAIFIICFCFYYLLRIFYFSLQQITGYFRVKTNLRKDWLKELRTIKNSPDQGGKVKDWKDIYHVVILPTYKEGAAIIKESIESLATCQYPKEKLIVVVATEERAGNSYKDAAEKIKKEYADTFFDFLVTSHPGTIVGEVAGKGSNVAWAGKEVKKLIDSLGINSDNVLISTFDIDTKIYNQYFSCVTWYYLTEEDNKRASYQPIPVYNNNIWKASFFARVVSFSNTFWQIIQQERPEKLTTYSSHTIPATTFFEVGYPSNIVCDDSRIFWKAYLYYNGNYRVVPIFYLVSMDVVDSSHIFTTIANQYRQQKRWAWGCTEIPYVLFGFLNNKEISFGKKVSHLYTLIDGYWSWATAALLLFMLGWLPLFLGGDKFNFTLLSFNLPILTSRIMTVALGGMLISAILSALLLPPFPRGISLFKKISIFVQWIFLPVILIIFGSFPAIDAQVRLMLGKYMEFWVTEKIRK